MDPFEVLFRRAEEKSYRKIGDEMGFTEAGVHKEAGKLLSGHDRLAIIMEGKVLVPLELRGVVRLVQILPYSGTPVNTS